MLFYEIYVEENNIYHKPLIRSQDKIITKFGPKKIGEFGFGQSLQKLLENLGKMLFYKTYFQESNINWKPLI